MSEREQTLCPAEVSTKGCGCFTVLHVTCHTQTYSGVVGSTTDAHPFGVVLPAGHTSFPHEWQAFAFEGYPGLCQNRGNIGCPTVQVWDQDPRVA